MTNSSLIRFAPAPSEASGRHKSGSEFVGRKWTSSSSSSSSSSSRSHLRLFAQSQAKPSDRRLARAPGLLSAARVMDIRPSLR